MNSQKRVYRPFGLTLAIIMGIVLFAAFPLLKLYFAWRLDDCSNDAGFDCGITGFSLDSWNWAGGILGAIVLISAIFAWIGKPPQIRFIFQGAVLITGLEIILEAIARSSGGSASSSAAEMMRNILRCQVPFQILLALYIIWYCNRAPARAFYRQEPLRSWQDQAKDKES